MRSCTALLFIVFLPFVGFAPSKAEEQWAPIWLAVPHPALNGIAIVLEKPSKTAKRVGVTESLISDVVELGLRRSNIRVDNDPNFWSTMLSIEVGVIPVETTGGTVVLHIYRIDFVLWKAVSTDVGPPFGTKWVRTDLWQTGVTGFTGDTANLPGLVSDQLAEFTGALSLDYLRAVTEHERAMKRWIATIP